MTRKTRLLLGQTLSFTGDPFVEGPNAAQYEMRGAVAMSDGRIVDVGLADVVRAAYDDADIEDLGQALIFHLLEINHRLPAGPLQRIC